jgi:hypothetical protein
MTEAANPSTLPHSAFLCILLFILTMYTLSCLKYDRSFWMLFVWAVCAFSLIFVWITEVF